MEVVKVKVYSEQVHAALDNLMPQLSSGVNRLSPSDLQAIISSEASSLYLAQEQGEYLGALTLVIFRIPTGLRAWIEDVVVSEDARGRGVATALVNHALTTAGEAGVKSIDLTSRSTRAPAIGLYKKLGFVERQTNVFRYHG